MTLKHTSIAFGRPRLKDINDAFLLLEEAQIKVIIILRSGELSFKFTTPCDRIGKAELERASMAGIESSFLKLPAELRNSIYSEVASRVRSLPLAQFGVKRHPLSCVNKQIEAEFNAVLNHVHPDFTSGSVVPKTISKVYLLVTSFTRVQFSKKWNELLKLRSDGHCEWEVVFISTW